MAESHVCAVDRTCCCSMIANEPEEKCPVHGWPESRCGTCGRWVKLTRHEQLEALADHGCDTWEEYRGER